MLFWCACKCSTWKHKWCRPKSRAEWYVIEFCMTHVCCHFFSLKGECEELHMKLSERTAHTKELEEQLYEKAEKGRLLQVRIYLHRIPHFEWVIWVHACHLCFIRHMQKECDSLHNLESALSEVKAHSEELKIQLDKQTENCQLMQVLPSCILFMSLTWYPSTYTLISLVTCNKTSAVFSIFSHTVCLELHSFSLDKFYHNGTSVI